MISFRIKFGDALVAAQFAPALLFALMPTGHCFAADQASADNHITPFTPWHAEAGKDACFLWRSLGNAANPLILRLQNKTSLELFDIEVIGERVRDWKPSEIMTVQFGRGDIQKIDRYELGITASGAPVIEIRSLGLRPFPSVGLYEPPIPEIEASISAVTINRGGRDLILETGSLKAPLTQLRKCTNELMVSWGVDPERYKTGRRATPANNPRGWLAGVRLPTSPALRGKQITFNYRLVVSPDGRAIDCAFENSSADEVVEKPICDAMTRAARFRPAVDATGHPMPDLYWSRIVWQVP